MENDNQQHYTDARGVASIPEKDKMRLMRAIELTNDRTDTEARRFRRDLFRLLLLGTLDHVGICVTDDMIAIHGHIGRERIDGGAHLVLR